MTWENVDLSTISPYQEPIAEGTYTFQLLSAVADEKGRLNIRAAVATDGEFTGRPITISLPSPEEQEWAARTVKRLQLVLGVDPLPGENPVEFLNRVAHSRFGAQVFHNKFTNKDTGEEVTTAKVKLSSFRPAA